MLACPILMIKDKFKKNENTNQSNKVLVNSLIDPADPLSDENTNQNIESQVASTS